jgi:hypothetical protein
MCDELQAYLKLLKAKKVKYSPVEEAPWKQDHFPPP